MGVFQHDLLWFCISQMAKKASIEYEAVTVTVILMGRSQLPSKHHETSVWECLWYSDHCNSALYMDDIESVLSLSQEMQRHTLKDITQLS